MQEVDALVIGSGAAGMTAALALSARGLRVLLVEATDQVGGTTSTSAGTLWLPCAASNAAARHCAGDVSCLAAARTYLKASIGTDADERKIDAFLDAAPELLRFLRERTSVRLEPVPTHPDYLQHLPGSTAGGRAFAATEFDGRLLGRAFALVRPPLPEFMVLGGMMVSKQDIPMLLGAGQNARAFFHSAKLVGRHLKDRLTHARGTRLVMGNALVGQLLHSVLRAGIHITFKATVSRIVRHRIGFSCVLTSAAGQQVLRIRRAVVLATGGYSGNSAMRERWMPALAQANSVAHRHNNGGGIELGVSLGAQVEENHASPAFWMPVSRLKRADGSVAVFPHIILDRAKPGLLAVDASGKRFVNEADSYHHFCQAMLRTPLRADGQRFFLVVDAAFIRRYGIGLVRPGLRSPTKYVDNRYLIAGNSPRQLARSLGLDEATLENTLLHYNNNADRGVDPEFQRGVSALNRHNGDAGHLPNPCLRALDLHELYAVEVHVADLGTSIGLATDANANALDSKGEGIPGLFACGNDMASVMRGSYPGPGTTLGPGMVFAWRAARRIATT